MSDVLFEACPVTECSWTRPFLDAPEVPDHDVTVCLAHLVTSHTQAEVEEEQVIRGRLIRGGQLPAEEADDQRVIFTLLNEARMALIRLRLPPEDWDNKGKW